MSNLDVRELLTAGQVAVVLHKSATTISRWARNGDLEVAARIASGQGVYLFDPEVVKQKALDLALGSDHGQTLDLEIVEEEPRRAS
jgi:hypothetical protein